MLEALLTTLAMTLIVAVRYLIVAGGFAWLSRRLRPGIYASERMARQMRAEIGWSLSAAAIYGVPAGLALWAWDTHGLTRIYTDPAAYGLLWLPASALAYLLVHDTWFYWTHRWMHVPWAFRAMHKVHHDSRPPTAWAAMSFHPWESLTGAIVIPALVFVIPIHIAALGVVLAIMTLFGVTNHMGWELFPRRLINGAFGKLVITASHHQRHHQDYNCNYGLYFRHWDRLCGTDRGLGDFDDRKATDRGVRAGVAGGKRA
jgi:sterol desaturase/sphingolipid hydroxylase (fatty acid hydroxylase superfamily)